MPLKDPVKKKEKNKEYRLKNKESIQKYREENKEKIKKYQKEYYEKNKEKLNERNKEYREKNKEKKKKYQQSDKAIKSNRITNWKQSGVVCDDFDILYDKYINTTNCEEGNIELTVDRYCTLTTRCLDHDHTTGLFRNVLCNRCNLSRG